MSGQLVSSHIFIIPLQVFVGRPPSITLIFSSPIQILFQIPVRTLATPLQNRHINSSKKKDVDEFGIIFKFICHAWITSFEFCWHCNQQSSRFSWKQLDDTVSLAWSQFCNDEDGESIGLEKKQKN